MMFNETCNNNIISHTIKKTRNIIDMATQRLASYIIICQYTNIRQIVINIS